MPEGESLYLRKFNLEEEMKFRYYPETDTLYVELKGTPSAESEEIAEGIVVDCDESGEIVGIEGVSKKGDVDIPIVGKLLLASAQK